tara:strand:+ start:139 stop:516 length:378 start_codon:yes stop_codon:yes gene_type:complete
MIIKNIGLNFEDDRGTISDIILNERIDYVTIITNQKGAIRGNHYHKETVQFLYVLEGSVLVASQKKNNNIEEKILIKGDLLFNEAYEAHAIKSLNESKLLILTRGLRGGKNYEADTYKLSKPLLK